jgi:hypothetical protein
MDEILAVRILPIPCNIYQQKADPRSATDRVDLCWLVTDAFANRKTLTASGMAAQIITDLGIHANIEVDSKYMHGRIDAQKTAALRKNAFWCAYTAEL